VDGFSTSTLAESLCASEHPQPKLTQLPRPTNFRSAAFPETIPFLLAVTREGETATWGPHLFFDDLDGALVGNGGWKGPPEAGTVELGYAVAPTRQGRGLATAAVRELLQRAQRAQVQRVLAHTLPRRSSSTTVLERCGFTQVGEEIDPEDGPVWRWELTLPVDP
jgi:[ribosomal protein S5]-alanine N-acetyltransferase